MPLEHSIQIPTSKSVSPTPVPSNNSPSPPYPSISPDFDPFSPIVPSSPTLLSLSITIPLPLESATPTRRSLRYRRQNVHLNDYVLSLLLNDFDVCLVDTTRDVIKDDFEGKLPSGRPFVRTSAHVRLYPAAAILPAYGFLQSADTVKTASARTPMSARTHLPPLPPFPSPLSLPSHSPSLPPPPSLPSAVRADVGLRPHGHEKNKIK
jgi:hypothetical protein